MFVWNELMTTDSEVASKFYCDLFGWETKQCEFNEIYKIISEKNKEIGGILQMGKEFGNMSSHWMPYMEVDDIDKAVEKIVELGGKAGKIKSMKIKR